MKVLVNCPGSWSHGLDSPERGEGRWAQNIARCLSQRPGTKVYATSGGSPRWGKGTVTPAVTLLREQDARHHGPYDLYFDASWWAGKTPIADAKHYFHVHWGFEQRLREPLPKNHHIVYVYATAEATFRDNVADPSRAHFLPVPLAEQMGKPRTGTGRILIPIRGVGDPNGDDVTRAAARVWGEAAKLLKKQFRGLVVVALKSPFISELRPDVVIPCNAQGIPYNQMRHEMASVGLNVPVAMAPACVPDCSVLGVPSLLGPRTWPQLLEVAKRHAWVEELTPEGFARAATRLFTDDALYFRYAAALQDLYADHVDGRVLELFDQLVGRL